jgi:hypothetical protein
MAKALSIYPVEPVTKAAARVTKFPVTCAVNRPFKAKNPVGIHIAASKS